MTEWEIYNKDGVLKATVESLELHDEWMAECFVTLTAKSANPIEFAVDDYIDYRGERYAIQYDPTVSKKAKRGSNGEGFLYENIKFVHEAQAKIVRCDFDDVVLNDNQIHYTALPTFPLYCETVDDLLDRVQANLEELYPGEFVLIGLNYNRNIHRAELVKELNGHDNIARVISEYDKWIGDSGTTDYGKKSVALTPDKITCWNALTYVNTEFDLNLIVRGYSVIVGTAGAFVSKKFKYGKDNGLFKLERVCDSEQQIITRLRAYGSEDNLPYYYYANLNTEYFLEVKSVEIVRMMVRKLVFDVSNSEARSMFKNTIPGSNVIPINGELESSSSSSSIDDSSSSLEEVTGGTVETAPNIDFWFLNPDGISYDPTLTGYVVETTSRLEDGEEYNIDCRVRYYPDSEENLVIFDLSGNFDDLEVGDKIYFKKNVNPNGWPARYKDNSNNNLPNNMAVTRLMLPGFPDQSLEDWVEGHKNLQGYEKLKEYCDETDADGNQMWRFSDDTNRPWIESSNADEFGVRPASIIFDGSDKENGEEIKPTLEGMTWDGYEADVILYAEEITDDGKLGENPDEERLFVEIRLPDVGFDMADLWVSGESSIEIKDGPCGARTFEIASKPTKVNGYWSCKCKRAYDSSLQLYFPYNDFPIIRSGEKTHYVLTGIELPSQYVEAASVKLLYAAIEALRKNHSPRYTWKPSIDEVWLARYEATRLNLPIPLPSIHDTIKAGDIFMFSDEDLKADTGIIIDTLVIKENSSGGYPTYEVTLRDEKQMTTIQKLQEKIDTVGAVAASGAGYTATQLISLVTGLIEEEGAKRFLWKVREDFATALVGFAKGFWVKAKNLFGFDEDGNVKANDGTFSGIVNVFKGILTHTIQSFNYTGGDMTGTGWKITDDNGEGNSSLTVDYLTVRMRAIFNELEVRKMIHTAGNYIFSPAGSIIERVDFYKRTTSGGVTTDTLLGYEYTKVPWLSRSLSIFPGGLFLAKKRIVRVGDINMNEVSFFRCYLKSDDGTTRTTNTWQEGMLARCQSFDISQTKREGDGDTQGNVFYWRKVTNVSTAAVSYPVKDDGYLHHYIDLSNVSGEYASQSMTPNAGDSIVCFGATTAAYSHAVTIETVGEDAPALKEFRGIGLYDDGTSGINWSLTGKLKTKISPSTGNAFYAPHFYVEVNNGTTDVATFMISTEGLLSEVKGKVDNGKNLLGGVLTADGWHNGSNVAATLTDEGYITTSGTLISPKLSLAKGTYTISFYAASAPNVNWRYYNDEREVGIAITQVSGESIGTLNRYKGTFTTIANNSRNYEFLFIASGSPTIYHPQLEEGESATAFSANSTEQESIMRQTASGVEIRVTEKIPAKNIIPLLNWTDSSNNVLTPDVKLEKVGTSNSFYSPQIYLEAGTYTFSAFLGSLQARVETRDTATGTATMMPTTSPYYYTFTAGTESYQSKTRRYFKFTLSAAKYVRINIYKPAQGTEDIYRPQLEKGNSMSAYVSIGDNVGSTGYADIKANEVNIGIQTGLENTGIDITTGNIVLNAAKTTINGDMQFKGLITESSQFINWDNADFLNQLGCLQIEVDMDEIKSLTVNPKGGVNEGEGCSLVLLPTNYAISGTHLIIRNPYNRDVANWSAYNFGSGASFTLDELVKYAVFVCASPMCFDQDVQNFAPFIPSANLDHQVGHMLLNGRRGRYLMLLPGQSVELISSIERFDENNSYLTWYIANANNFVPMSGVSIDYEVDKSDGTTVNFNASVAEDAYQIYDLGGHNTYQFFGNSIFNGYTFDALVGYRVGNQYYQDVKFLGKL